MRCQCHRSRRPGGGVKMATKTEDKFEDERSHPAANEGQCGVFDGFDYFEQASRSIRRQSKDLKFQRRGD